MTAFLTVKQAAQKAGKSTSSIRRILYPIIQADDHPDRSEIRPTVEEVKQLRVKGENFPWKISEALLDRVLPATESPAEEPPKRRTAKGTEAASDVLVILERELEIKNHQIAAQNDVIKGLSERLHEGNILIGSLQQQLSLTDGSHRKNSRVMDAHAAGAGESEPQETRDSPRRGLFRRLFSRR